MIDETLQPIQIKNWTQGFQTQLRTSTKRTLSRLKSIESNTISHDPPSDLSTKFKTNQKTIKISDRCIHSQYASRKISFKQKQPTQTIFQQPLCKAPLYMQLIPFFKVSAQSWAIFNGNTGEYITGYNQNKCRQIASITKIVTCIIENAFLFQIKLINQTKQAQKISGTSAGLLKGDSIFLRDLLYGLMLPSGNDAAVTLSYNFQLYSLENDHFLKEMNRFVQALGLSNTQFSNVHGLCNENNFSTAYDVGKFTYESLQNEQFQKIVRTQSYFCETPNQLQNTSRELYWENTNKLLQQGFKGVKTGITKEAGPSVVEYFQDSTNSYIIVLLNCSSSENRWTDALRLLQWIQKQDTLIKQFI
ncbi:unnamed protein product (macronuclear) [Paramecium tetraurelia]|uniref:Peptidase S11 D-alanyl-D-alanine carboxypeptidase A N-terminal domain-containing protein n=1 Tax=Paramecium tetraurelia TaxID=5888 RepID=A0CKP5_PARTE|nr:uncharacterized protein GSPATT00001076001 [Paramecium tetraurelia]CAK71362.1 unnamed protein product [Paramecium tetraurelia]|eukprot:XP_001438759.1 hypothetical protein (macronuclear) [Paramecium tetraurelia strain d4-2]